jgi:membrane-associated protein
MEWLNTLMEFVLNVDEHLHELVRLYGIYIYVILFLIIFCETGLVITPFLPGDSLLFAAGALAASGNMNILMLCLICFVAAILGNQINFVIGKFFGPKIFETERKYLKKDHLVTTQEFYDKHGGKALIIGRYMPFIRTFVPFVAGIGQMNTYRFTYFNIVGALLWVVPLLGIGYLFGNIPIVKENFSIIIIAILIVSLLPMIIGIVSAWRHSKK